MNIYEVICGTCSGRSFKYADGEYRCQGCGRILSEDEISKLLTQAHDDYATKKNGK